MAELYDIWHSLERLLLYMVGVGCFASSPFSVVKVLKGFSKKNCYKIHNFHLTAGRL